MKSGNRTFLEPFGPVQACNGIALPFLCIKLQRFVSTDLEFKMAVTCEVFNSRQSESF